MNRHSGGVFDHLVPMELEAILDAIEDGVFLLDRDLAIVAVNETVLKDTGFRKPDLVGSPAEELIDTGKRSCGLDKAVRNCQQFESPPNALDWGIRTVEGTHVPARFSIARRETAIGRTGYLIIYHPLAPQHSHRRRSQRERLALVNQYNATLRKVTRSIIDSTRRDSLEQTVCEALAGTPAYEFAILAEQHSAKRPSDIEPRAWAGIEAAVVSDLLAPIEAETGTECPISQAIRSGSVQTKTEIFREPHIQACLTDDRIEDVASVAVTPIRFEETTYGILAVYSNRDGPFDDFEIRMLEELGSIIGFAYNAVDKNELLVSDSVLELQFAISDMDSFFVATSAREACTIELKSVVPRTDGSLLYYHRIDGVQAERVCDRAEESPQIESVEIMDRNEGDAILAFELSESSLVEQLSIQNMHVRQIIAQDGEVSLVLEVSPVIDPNTAVKVIESKYDEFELVSKRKIERPVLPSQQVIPDIDRRLTSKQRDTLVAALENGYFDRPRTTSAEHVAAQLGISSSTFHQHLREGLRKVVSGVFDSDRRKSSPWRRGN